MFASNHSEKFSKKKQTNKLNKFPFHPFFPFFPEISKENMDLFLVEFQRVQLVQLPTEVSLK